MGNPAMATGPVAARPPVGEFRFGNDFLQNALECLAHGLEHLADPTLAERARQQERNRGPTDEQKARQDAAVVAFREIFGRSGDRQRDAHPKAKPTRDRGIFWNTWVQHDLKFAIQSLAQAIDLVQLAYLWEIDPHLVWKKAPEKKGDVGEVINRKAVFERVAERFPGAGENPYEQIPEFVKHSSKGKKSPTVKDCIGALHDCRDEFTHRLVPRSPLELVGAALLGVAVFSTLSSRLFDEWSRENLRVSGGQTSDDTAWRILIHQLANPLLDPEFDPEAEPEEGDNFVWLDWCGNNCGNLPLPLHNARIQTVVMEGHRRWVWGDVFSRTLQCAICSSKRSEVWCSGCTSYVAENQCTMESRLFEREDGWPEPCMIAYCRNCVNRAGGLESDKK